MHECVLELRKAIPIPNEEDGDGEYATEGERLFLVECSANAEIIELKKRLQRLDEAPAEIGIWD